eukprot:CAMPEP_0197032138 /NCGR_PEP_ID=MMETSP1384-20130603/10885_1 /TAXON_ID=29189 /ORGANISM="Ammonia sp." /LENGTH=50 /DNA_ID=CAMNT_0042461747 /DNA_START=75 /DNA_END=227 /DNA_ORIENTATION=-
MDVFESLPKKSYLIEVAKYIAVNATNHHRNIVRDSRHSALASNDDANKSA